MKKMRKGKIVAVLVVLAMTAVALASCGNGNSISEVISVGTLKGPTGMGMINLMDEPESYDITTYEAPNEITAKLINGELDVAAVPSNLAAVLYNKTKGNIVAISPNTLGILYLTENKTANVKSSSDIKDQTIYASGKGGSPEYILQEVLTKNKLDYASLNIKWLATHSDVTAAHMKDPGSIALLPEPFVTVATSKNPNVKVVSDLNKEWDKITHQDLPMGVLVAQKSFVEEKGSDLEIFLNDYEASVDYVNNSPKEAAEAIASQGIIADAKIAEKAIPNCNIVLFTNSESKETLSAFYETLFKMDPKSIGGKLPGDDFYYETK